MIDSFNPGKLPPIGAGRFKRLQDAMSPYPEVNLGAVLDDCQKQPDQVDVEGLRRILDTDELPDSFRIERMMNQARSALAYAIGDVWRRWKAYDQSTLGKSAFQWHLKRAYPIDAIAGYSLAIFKIAAEDWARDCDPKNPLNQLLKINAKLNGSINLERHPAETIRRGAAIGTSIILALIEVVPRRFKMQFGITMPAKSVDDSTHYECHRPFLSVWKGLKGGEVVDVFEENLFQKYLRPLPLGEIRTTIDPKNVELMQTTKGVWIAFPKETVVGAIEKLKPEPAYMSRGKCPANAALSLSTSNHKSEPVLVDYAKRLFDLARQHWLPNYNL